MKTKDKKISWLGFFNAFIFMLLFFISTYKYDRKPITGFDFTSMSFAFIFYIIFLLVRVEVLNENIQSLKKRIDEIEGRIN